jgi:hypothetical protein
MSYAFCSNFNQIATFFFFPLRILRRRRPLAYRIIVFFPLEQPSSTHQHPPEFAEMQNDATTRKSPHDGSSTHRKREFSSDDSDSPDDPSDRSRRHNSSVKKRYSWRGIDGIVKQSSGITTISEDDPAFKALFERICQLQNSRGCRCCGYGVLASRLWITYKRRMAHSVIILVSAETQSQHSAADLLR